MKIFHTDKREDFKSRSRKQNGNPERSGLPLSFFAALIELGRGVVNSGEAFTRHGASPFDHLAGDDKFLDALL